MINGDDMTSLAYLLDPCFQIVNTAGKPLTEGYIEVYYQGTRDKYYCSCDFDGTLLPFQIPLDSLGSNIVLASPDNAYDIYIYNKYGSLIMSRYNVKTGHGAGGGLTTITVTSNDNTVQIERTGNNYDLSIKETIDRIDNLEDKINDIIRDTSYSVANGYGDNGTFVLTDKDTKDITYLNDMSGWRLLPGKVYQLNFNSKFTLDDNYNNLVEGKLYLDGNMSFSQDWSFSLDDSFDHVHHINGSTIIVVPNTLQYYDLALNYTFNSVVNCSVDLENISIVDITSILKDYTVYTEGVGIDIEDNVISVDMDYINEQINIDEKLSSAINICNEYTDNSINTTINEIASATATLEQEIQNIPPQVQSDWAQEDSNEIDYIKNKPGQIELIAGQNIGIFEGIGTLTIAASATDLSNCATHGEVYNSSVTAINSANSYTDTAISNIDFSDYATHGEVYSATSSAISSANSYTDTAIANIDFSNYATHGEIYSATSTALNAANNYTDSAIANIDLSDYATHSEVYNSSVTAISSANSYTDTAIANLDLTPAVEIVSPNNTISVSSVTDSVNNTKTFYLDTNSQDLNYWMGNSDVVLNNKGTPGNVGYYKEIFDEAHKVKGNLDITSLNKGLYLLTVNMMGVASGVNNDMIEYQIYSHSSSALSYVNSVYQHDCSLCNSIGEPADQSHQIATLVKVMYDGTPISLTATMNDPLDVTNELHLWFSDICLYELNGASIGGGSTPSGSGVIYEDGWGIIINGNVISVDSSIIPDISNLASETYVNAKLTSAINVIESEIPDTSDMATKTWVGNQGYLTTIPSQYVTDTELSNELSNYALASAIPDVSDMATQTWVGQQGYLTSIPSSYATDAEVSAAIATATNDMATKTWVGNQSYVNSSQASAIAEAEIANVETLDIDVCPIIAGSNITITASGNSAVISSTGGGTTYTAGNGIDITNDEISIDNTVALKTDIPAPVSGASGISVNNSVISLDNPVNLIGGDNITISVSGNSAVIDTYKCVTYTGNTAINHIQFVTTLPNPADSNTLYLIPEA